MNYELPTISAYYSKNLGSYNWANPSEKQWNLYLQTTFGNISATFREDAEPDVDDLLPSEVLDLIEARLKSYLFSSSRAQDLETIAKIRAHRNEVDTAWLRRKVSDAASRLKGYERRLQNLLDDIADAEDAPVVTA